MVTLTAQQMLDAYQAAEVALLQGGKTVRFNDGVNDRLLTREDLQWVQLGRREWQAKVSAAAARTARAPTIGGLGYSVARMDGH